MSKSAFVTLALAMFSAGLASPSAAQTAILQRCDKPMADVERLSRTISECDGLLRAAALSLAKTDPSLARTEEKVVTTTAPLSEALVLAAVAEPLYGRLLAYHVYSAFASRDLALCSPLSHIGDAQEADCRRAVADLEFVKARYGSNAEFAAACRRAENGEGQGAEASRCCSLLAEGRGSVDTCSKLAPKCASEAKCRVFFGSMAGDARVCRSLPPLSEDRCRGAEECRRLRAEAVADCEGDAVFAKAFKAGSGAACAGSRRCRVLMGEGKAVIREIAEKDLRGPVGAWFLNKGWLTPVVAGRVRVPVNAPPPTRAAPVKLEFQGFVCEEPLTSTQNHAALTAVLAAARMCLTDVETALARPSREMLAALDEREEELARYSLRLNKYFDAGKPAKAPARPRR